MINLLPAHCTCLLQ